MSAGQRSLFGGREVAVDGAFGTLRRRELDGGAWVDYAPGWLAGHDALLDHLVRTTTWQQPQREMYDRTVDVPRLCASLPDDGPGHPAVETMRRALSARYAVDLPHVSLGYYRDGRDSVAWHGDYVAREMDEALVATVSLGEPRRLLLRPTGGGVSVGFSLGGSAQRTWQHAVPKVAHADPRLAVMFRPTWYRKAR